MPSNFLDTIHVIIVVGGDTMDEYVYLIPLPGRIRETVSYNADGSHTILIRDDLPREEQLKAYAHARRHIEEYDFEKADVQEIEAEAHAKNTQDF